MLGLVDVTPSSMTRDISTSSTNIHRERIDYIVKDTILKLVGHNRNNTKKKELQIEKDL